MYYQINETTALRAKEMMSFSDYKEGSATASYRAEVDQAIEIAERQKRRVDPMYHDKIDRLLDLYARKLAENRNKHYEIMTRCPSILIAGPANFPVRKKEKQNAADDKNMREYQEIQGILDKIKGVGMGGISGDDPKAIEKLEAKLARREQAQERMKAANAALRMKDTAKGDARLKELGYTEEAIKQLREPDFAGRVGYPAYALSNNNANIRRIRERIADLKKRQSEDGPEGWSFDGGQIVRNTTENRLQIIFDDIPAADTRSALKSHGFRWSPRNKAWQRQLTRNAELDARNILGIQ